MDARLCDDNPIGLEFDDIAQTANTKIIKVSAPRTLRRINKKARKLSTRTISNQCTGYACQSVSLPVICQSVMMLNLELKFHTFTLCFIGQGRLHHVSLGANAPKKILGGNDFAMLKKSLGGRIFFNTAP